MKLTLISLVALCWTLGCVADSGETGGKTNWLSCVRNADCAEQPGTTCVNERCEPTTGDAAIDATETDDSVATEAAGNESEDSPSEDSPSEDFPSEDSPSEDSDPRSSEPIRASSSKDASTASEGTAEACFGPSSNLESAYSCEMDGCACDADPEAADQCVQGAEGNWYALRCSDGHWQGVDNRQCATETERCFNLTDNVELAESGTIDGCECPEYCADDGCENCAVGDGVFVPMACFGERWQVLSFNDCQGLSQDLCTGVVNAYYCVSPTQNVDKVADGAGGCQCFYGIDQVSCVDGVRFSCGDDLQWTATVDPNCEASLQDAGMDTGPAAAQRATYNLELTPYLDAGNSPEAMAWLLAGSFAQLPQAWLASSGERDAEGVITGYTYGNTAIQCAVRAVLVECEPFEVQLSANNEWLRFDTFYFINQGAGDIGGSASGQWSHLVNDALVDTIFDAGIEVKPDQEAPRAEIIDANATLRASDTVTVALSEPILAPSAQQVRVVSGGGDVPIRLTLVDDARDGLVTQLQLAAEDGWPAGEELQFQALELSDGAGNVVESIELGSLSVEGADAGSAD